MKIVYLAGPADAVTAYRATEAGQASEYFGSSYICQFFDICRKHAWRCNVITTTDAAYFEKSFGAVTIQNRPPLTGQSSGMMFHVRSLIWMIAALVSVIRYRPDVIIMTAFQNYWFVFAPLRLLGVKMILAFHGALWLPNDRHKKTWRLLWFLNKHLILKRSAAILGASDSVAEQLIEFIGGSTQVQRFLPTYRREQFAPVAKPPAQREPFKVFFAGRIEVNKGVFDVLTMAERLNRGNSGRFIFDMCGYGGAFDALQLAIAQRNLGQWVITHGYCDAERMTAILGTSHVAVVPTTGEIEEGYNMVVAEAVLGGRPVVTSRACPALLDVYPAAVEARIDNIDDYVAAILRLKEDEDFYLEKLRNCVLVQDKFYEESRSWRSAVEPALLKCDPCGTSA